MVKVELSSHSGKNAVEIFQLIENISDSLEHNYKSSKTVPNNQPVDWEQVLVCVFFSLIFCLYNAPLNRQVGKLPAAFSVCGHLHKLPIGGLITRQGWTGLSTSTSISRCGRVHRSNADHGQAWQPTVGRLRSLLQGQWSYVQSWVQPWQNGKRLVFSDICGRMCLKRSRGLYAELFISKANLMCEQELQRVVPLSTM